MRGLVAVVALGAALYGAGIAQAGTVTLANGVMSFEAGSGGPGKEDRARVDRGLDKLYDMEELF